MLDRMTEQLDALLRNQKVIMDKIMDLNSCKEGIFQD